MAAAPNLAKLANGTDALKELCGKIDLVELGEDTLRLTLTDFERKGGADEKSLREFLPMFQLIVKVLDPIHKLPGLPKPLGDLFNDIKSVNTGTQEEVIRRAKQKTLYEPLFRFLMDVRIQDLLLGKNTYFNIFHHLFIIFLES